MGLFRLLLAFSVVLAHCGYGHSFIGFGAENAVEIFFLISGFYISNALTNYGKRNKFYLNRFLKIYPIYFIVLGLTLIFSIFSLNTRQLITAPESLKFEQIFTNATLIGADFYYFIFHSETGLNFGSFTRSDLPLAYLMLIPPAWSHSLEIYFYLMAPFLCSKSAYFKISIILLSFGVRGISYAYGLKSDPWTYRFFPFELGFFMLGSLLFSLKSSKRIKLQLPKKNELRVDNFAFCFIWVD